MSDSYDGFNPTRVRLKLVATASVLVPAQALQPHKGPSETRETVEERS